MAKTIKNAYTPRLKALYDGTYKKNYKPNWDLVISIKFQNSKKL